MKENHKLISNIVNLVLFLSIFLAVLYPSIDPDLGWHLKYGEYFFENGHILRDNIFSALMPDYHWNNSSWATDLISYQVFKNFGFIGISAFGALIVTLTFFIIGKAAKLNLFEKSIIFPIIVFLISPVNLISFRGQQVTLLLLTTMYLVLSRYAVNKKIVFLLVPLFALWSNLHGEYILGLGILGIWIFVYLIKEAYLNYKNDIRNLLFSEKYLIAAFIGCVLGTLINPFGIGVYLETFRHLSDPLQKSIAEWLAPLDFSTVWWHQLFAGLVLIMGVALLGTGKKNLDKAPFYVPSFVLFIFTFWIRRYAWPFYYLLIFLLQPVVKFFEPPDKKQSLYSTFVISLLFLGSVLYIKKPFTSIQKQSWSQYCKSSIKCSPAAAQTVINNKLNNEKLLTIYDYGGWLIWNYPEIKPTIDGRMHLWRNSAGYSAFEYYYAIEQNLKDIDDSDYDAVLTSQTKPIYFRLLELSKEGKWKPLHVDKFGAVFVRSKPTILPNTN